MTDAPTVSARTVAVLVAAVNLRRLYRTHVTDPQVRDDLGTLARIAYEWHQVNTDVRDVGIDQPPPPPWELTADQAATVLGVSPQAVRRALRAGRLTGVKKGRQWSITIRDLADYQTRHPGGGGTRWPPTTPTRPSASARPTTGSSTASAPGTPARRSPRNSATP